MSSFATVVIGVIVFAVVARLLGVTLTWELSFLWAIAFTNGRVVQSLLQSEPAHD